MSWWLWMLLGIVLLGVELLTPGGFWILFFGAGAIAVGLLELAGLGMPPAVQWLSFSALSLLALVTLRRPLLRKFTAHPPPKGDIDRIAGETAVAISRIEPNGIGKAELRGTTWNARNVGTNAVEAGERCHVDHVDGLMLWIRAV